jgi:3-oxoacyl-[acyl-carrier-protein] synthase-3
VSLEHVLRSAPDWSAGAPALVRTAGIAGIGVALPERSVSNAELVPRLGVPPGWIEKRTGIEARRRAEPGTRVSELAARAGQRALDAAGLAAEELDLVLVATLAPDEVTPPAAPVVAEQLGAAGAGAIDVGAACSGAIAALALAAAQVEAGHAEHVLVIGAEILSRFTDLDDRRTAPLFGDGAGAIVVSLDGGGRLGPFVLGSDGGASAAIRVSRERGVIEMEGHETFLHAVYRLSSSTRELLQRAGLGLDDVDLFVYHQANARILEAVAERLEVPAARVFDCIGRLGNTSAASVPLALHAASAAGVLAPGACVVVGAVGAGLTWGAGLARWEPR